MKWLARFLMVLLAIALTVSVGAWILNRTVWNASYLEQKATEAKLADGLATTLPSALAATTSTPADTETVLTSAITPAYVSDQLQTLIELLERYWRQGGQAPTLDLSGLEPRITAAGLPVPPALDQTLNKPITIGKPGLDGTLASSSQHTAQLTWAGPLASAVLAALIFLTARGRRWLVLAEGVIGGAIGCGVLMLVALLPPSLVASVLNTSALRVLVVPIRHYTEVIAHDQIHQLLIAAIALVVLALVLVLIHAIVRVGARFSGKARHHAG